MCPAPSWGRAISPCPWTSHPHRRPHRLQRRALAAHGHRPGHRGHLHPHARQLPLRDRLGPVPRPADRDRAGATPPRSPTRRRWRPALLRAQAPPSGGVARVTSTLPVGAGLSSSAAFAVALLLALGHDPDPLALARDCQEAERGAGSHVGLLDPLAIAGAGAGHALHIDFATLEMHQVPHPRGGGLRHRAQRGAPAAHQHALRHPAGRVRTGRAHHRPAPRHLRDRRPRAR